MMYKSTIGIEVHVELKTKSKIFSNSLNGYGLSANSLTNAIDLGYPGTLPTINKEVINQALKACLILNCKINKKMHFDRKNYFYPDNSKNYQITQNKTPIGTNGYVLIEVDGTSKKIEIEEMHIEEDTCKSTHRKDVTLLDFNRAGIPLIEIVTKPCIENSVEAKLYLEKLKELLFYAGISDCKMEEGSMRCDANVSISKDDNLGVKCEIKNIGSISNVGFSIDKEIVRQTELKEAGKTFKEQTRRYDSKKKDTVLMRIKETGNDYRYFEEPDIPYVVITDDMIEEAKQTIPLLPDTLRKKYTSLGISLKSANKLINNISLSNYFNTLLDANIDFVIASNLLLGDISYYLNKNKLNINDTTLTKDKFIELVNKISSNTLTSKNLKDILTNILESNDSLTKIMKDNNISNITDDTSLNEIITKIIDNNKKSVTDYLNGHDRALKYLMGQVMKETKGSANPKKTMEILTEKLKNID